MNQSYCYSFRFCCDPGFNDRREIASLRRFVREAQIDDVAVFCLSLIDISEPTRPISI